MHPFRVTGAEKREIGVADAAPLRGSAGGDEC